MTKGLEPEVGDFFLAPISGIGGLGIRIGQWLNGDGFLKIQHAGIYVGEGKTIEAMPGGAILGDLSRFDPDSLVWSTAIIGLSHSQRESIKTYALAEKGTPYGGLDYLALFLHRFHIRTPGLKHYIMTSGHMICSQLVDREYTRAGVHLFDDGRWDGDVTPGDLYHMLER
jgi:uncharacterized protein YycO